MTDTGGRASAITHSSLTYDQTSIVSLIRPHLFRITMLGRAIASSSRIVRCSTAPRAIVVPAFARPNSTAAHPANHDEGEARIYQILRNRFAGKQLEVQDISGQPVSSSAERYLMDIGGCGSFYAILLSSPEFKGLSMIKQHKLVNEALGDEIKGLHGLQVS